MAKKSFIDKLQSLSANRKGEENAFDNLVGSLYAERMFVHILLSQKLPEIWTKKIISHYVVSLVTCWETFFRDVFVFVLKRNSGIAEELAKNARVRKVLDHGPVSETDHAEYVASLFNFQNLSSLLEAFGPILGERGSLDLPASEEVFINSKRYGWAVFSLPGLFPRWKENLDFILQERHRIIHDANHACTISRKEIAELESVLFFYLQLFGIFVSSTVDLPWIKLDITTSYLSITPNSGSNWRNIVITINDLLSDDWETQP